MSASAGDFAKVILLGNVGVGKTSMFLRLKDGRFQDDSSSVGVDRVAKPFVLDSGGVGTLDIWDTAGLEGFRTVTRSYYYGAKAVVLVYDLTSSKSFFDLPLWHQDATTFAPAAAVFLVGNKSDLGEDEVGEEVVQQFVDAYDVKMHFRVSVKDGTGLREAFAAIAQYLLNHATVSGSNRLSSSLIQSDEQAKTCSC